MEGELCNENKEAYDFLNLAQESCTHQQLGRAREPTERSVPEWGKNHSDDSNHTSEKWPRVDQKSFW